MNKLACIIIPLLTALLCMNAKGDVKENNDWCAFTESSFHKWFYDNKRIESSGGAVKVWTKSVAKEQSSINEKVRLLIKFGGRTWGYEKYSYTINLFEIDCRNNKQRVVMIQDYDSNDCILDTEVLPYNTFESIPASSVINTLSTIICSHSMVKK